MSNSSTINIKALNDKDSMLKINSKLCLALGLEGKMKGCLSYGTQKCYVDIEILKGAGDHDFYLSKNVIDYLHLPDYPDFEVCLKGGEIMIGPHIGVIAFKHDEYITDSYLKYAIDFIPEYSKFHGSAIIFAIDKIDQSKRLVEGYCYNPKSRSYVRGVFPYPLSIFLMLLLDPDLKNHFLSVIGNTVFNNFFTDKYKMHKLLSMNPEFVPHLPDTILYKSPQDVFDMLKKYGTVYVKSISGQCGKEVTMISRDTSGRITLGYRRKKNNVENIVEDSNDGRKFIEDLFIPDKFIVQQGIDLMIYEGRAFDFRHMIQKDDSGKWVSKGIIGRIAAPGSVVSNISNGGKAMWAADLLKKSLSLSDMEAADFVNKMASFGSSICDELDKSGIMYGDLGIDLGIDKNKHVWIIEINSRGPDPYIAMSVHDKRLFKDLLSTPLLYAKYLAGFGK